MKLFPVKDSLTILPEWHDALSRAGLASLEQLLSFSTEECLSLHLRGKTSRFQLPNEQIIYIKQDHFTKWQTILRQLLWLRKPQPNTEKERRRLALAASFGIRVPEVIAWGQRRRWGLPHQGVMVMLDIQGIPLDQYLMQENNPGKRREAILKAEQTLLFLQEHRLDWCTDCKPEHFFVLRDGNIGLIDLERLRLRGKNLSAKIRKKQFDRFRSLLPQKEKVQCQ